MIVYHYKCCHSSQRLIFKSETEGTCNNEQTSASSVISIYDHNLYCNTTIERWVWYFLWWSISHSSYGSAQLGFSHCVISELFYLKNWTKLKVIHVNLYVWYVTLMKQSITYFSTCQLPELVVKGFFLIHFRTQG